jgi:hypothetical protein
MMTRPFRAGLQLASIGSEGIFIHIFYTPIVCYALHVPTICQVMITFQSS